MDMDIYIYIYICMYTCLHVDGVANWVARPRWRYAKINTDKCHFELIRSDQNDEQCTTSHPLAKRNRNGVMSGVGRRMALGWQKSWLYSKCDEPSLLWNCAIKNLAEEPALQHAVQPFGKFINYFSSNNAHLLQELG